MQLVVHFFAKLMTRFMGASGAESTSVAASIFMGQTEAPLTIRPFIASMTMSELMTIMTAGMAHISGGIMAAYVLVAKVDVIHLLTAVIMTAPGAIMMSKIIVPEVETPKTGGDVEVVVPKQDVNIIDAAGRGAIEGLHLSLNVAGMLIAFIALVKLGEPGVGSSLAPRSFVITTYALCGFANFSSIAIQIGGIGSLAPTRRGDLARLGLRAMLAGTLANFLTATIAGMLL